MNTKTDTKQKDLSYGHALVEEGGTQAALGALTAYLRQRQLI